MAEIYRAKIAAPAMADRDLGRIRSPADTLLGGPDGALATTLTGADQESAALRPNLAGIWMVRLRVSDRDGPVGCYKVMI